MREYKWCFFHDMPAHNEYEHRPNEMCDVAEGVMIRSDSVLYEPGLENIDRTRQGRTLEQLLREVDDHIAWLLEVGGLVQVLPEGDNDNAANIIAKKT